MPDAGEDVSPPPIVLTVWDLLASTLTFHRADNTWAEMAAPKSALADSRIVKIAWSELLGGIVVDIDTGETIALEMPRIGGEDALGDRLVVYLDQNHWSSLARARHAPRPLTAESAAAEQLEAWVQARQIILPLSAGHHVETTQYDSQDSRFALAVTMMQLSRGWQMRAPVAVRKNEMYEAFRTRFATPAPPRSRPVFSLEPLITSEGLAPTAAPPDLPPAYAHVMQALEAVTVTIGVLLDPEVIERGDLSRWVDAQQAFSDRLDTQSGLDRGLRRQLADQFLLEDLRDEIAAEASASMIHPDQFKSWVSDYRGGRLDGMRSLDLYRVVQRTRHMAPGVAWAANDLLDMTHLSCAAAYADFVVAERHQTSMLNQALRSLGQPQIVSRRLVDAVPGIRIALEKRRAGGQVDWPTG